MTAPTLTWKQILQLQPCASDRVSARAKLKAMFPDIDKRELTLADAAAAGHTSTAAQEALTVTPR